MKAILVAVFVLVGTGFVSLVGLLPVLGFVFLLGAVALIARGDDKAGV